MSAVGSRGGSAGQPTVLWWGRFDPAYSRNAILRACFSSLGWNVADFRPRVSALGDAQARLGDWRADLIWVPCFRQRDVQAAARYARRIGVPLFADPLISTYDKQVSEWQKFSADSRAAERLLAWERRCLGRADCVVADTHEHARFFHDTLGIRSDRIVVIPVGAEERLFKPMPMPPTEAGLEVLFFGSFLPLQGPTTIVKATRLLTAGELLVTMLGDGPLKGACQALAHGDTRLRFEPWLSYERLPARIAEAHLVLGAFGDTPKAGRVIPNKVYQALACSRPVVTRHASSYPAELMERPWPGLHFVDAGSPEALAHELEILLRSRENLAVEACGARSIYEAWFASPRVLDALARALAGLPVAGSGGAA